jgi:aspartate-semialdehyde dehydrogenase
MVIFAPETFAIYLSFSISFNITMNIAIVGATGNVGRKIIEVLEKKKLDIDNLYLLASARSAGSKINFNGKEHEVLDLENFDFSGIKITFFAAGGKISENFVEKVAKHSLVIDNSSFYRMDPDVPLIVPQVNSDHLKNIKKNIIANPNCSTAQLVIALKPLHDLFIIKRLVISTYQSVSGGGKAPMDELIEQTKLVLENKKVEPKNFTKQIAFNVIPHIDVFSDDGYTKEELKMVNETKKILDNKIDLTATCVRLPVLVSHSESVNIEFENTFTLEKVREALNNFEGCKVIDKRSDGGYSTPLEAEGRDETFISRIREDKTINNGLNMWIVSDNLLRGAALNSVEIAETLIKNNFYGK